MIRHPKISQVELTSKSFRLHTKDFGSTVDEQSKTKETSTNLLEDGDEAPKETIQSGNRWTVRSWSVATSTGTRCR